MALLGALAFVVALLFASVVTAQEDPSASSEVEEEEDDEGIELLELHRCADLQSMAERAAEARTEHGKPGAVRRIQALDFQCDPMVCAAPEMKKSLLKVLDLCVGTAWPEDEEEATAIRLAIVKRLKTTGFFEDVKVKPPEKVPGGVRLTIETRGATVIRSVEYHGNWPLLESEVEKRLQLRRGQILSDDRTSLKVQQASVEDLYALNGFYDTRVRIEESRTVGENLVDINVQIEKGRELEVTRVVVGGHKVFKYSKIRGLLLEPIGWFGSYTEAALKKGIEGILKEYRDRGYFRARVVDRWINPNYVEGTVEVRLEIDEGPRWKMEFVGNSYFSREELLEATTFQTSGYVDKVEIARSIEAIQDLYETAGFFFTHVQAQEVKLSPERRTIDFKITEGASGEVQEIVFEGNEHVEDRELLEVMKTRAYGVFGSGTLQRNGIESDLAQIVNLYQSRGYLRARAPSWSMKVSEDGGEYDLTIRLKEGPQTLVEEISVVDNQILSSEEILKKIQLKNGDPFSLGELERDLGRVIQLYKPWGYPQIQVGAECSEDGKNWKECALPSVKSSCIPRDRGARKKAGLCGDGLVNREMTCRRTLPERGCFPRGGIQGSRVFVRLKVSEGRQMRVGEIFLQGNFRTRAHVIFDSVPIKKGDLFVFDNVHEGQRELRSLGLFESISIKHIGFQEDAISERSESNLISLVITVEELPARFWDLRLDFSTRQLLQDDSGLLITLESALAENNLLGYGNSVQFKLRTALDVFQVQEALNLSNISNDNVQSYTDRFRRLDFLAATELVFFDPRSILFRSELTVTGFYTLDLLGAEIFTLDKEEIGLRASVRDRFTKRLVGQLSLEQKRTATRLREDGPRNADGARLFGPRRDSTVLGPTVFYDRRDSPLNPKNGYFLETSLDLAFDFLFGTGTNFMKWSGSYSHFWTFFKTLTLGYGWTLGYARPLLDAEIIPQDERFQVVGGTGLRGFANNGIGPRNPTVFQSIGGELLALNHLEVRYPLFKDLKIYGSQFLDTGILVDCRENLEPRESLAPGKRISCLDDVGVEDIRTSAGIGISWLALDQIPFSLYYGMVLDRQLGEGFGDFQLSFGSSF